MPVPKTSPAPRTLTAENVVLETLMYSSDAKIKPDEGIMRLCKEIRDHWSGNILPHTQYGLKEAWDIISRAEQMDVAFAVRSNLTFNGFHDDDSPIHGKAVTFRASDCLHVKAKYNEDWWIGRVIKVDAPIGFIPTPMKLKKLAQEAANQQATKENIMRKTQNLEKDKKADKPPPETQAKPNSNSGSVESLAIPQTRVSEIDTKAQGPYEAVPVTRPIVLCGPSLRGFEITDLMHKALIHALKKQFDDRLELFPIDEKCLKAFQTSIANTSNKGVYQTDALEDVVERVFLASRSFKLLFVDLKINSPLPLRGSALAPILVHIKISNMKVLQNLIKHRGSDQKRGLTAQVYAATKLCDLDRRNFDVVLSEHDFDDAAEHLINYLEKYWRASRPYQTTRKHDSILRSSITPGIISKLVIKSPKLPHNSYNAGVPKKDHKEPHKKEHNTAIGTR